MFFVNYNVNKVNVEVNVNKVNVKANVKVVLLLPELYVPALVAGQPTRSANRATEGGGRVRPALCVCVPHGCSYLQNDTHSHWLALPLVLLTLTLLTLTLTHEI